MARLVINLICLVWALYAASWVASVYHHLGFFAGLLSVFFGSLATVFLGAYIQCWIDAYYEDEP